MTENLHSELALIQASIRTLMSDTVYTFLKRKWGEANEDLNEREKEVLETFEKDLEYLRSQTVFYQTEIIRHASMSQMYDH